MIERMGGQRLEHTGNSCVSFRRDRHSTIIIRGFEGADVEHLFQCSGLPPCTWCLHDFSKEKTNAAPQPYGQPNSHEISSTILARIEAYQRSGRRVPILDKYLLLVSSFRSSAPSQNLRGDAPAEQDATPGVLVGGCSCICRLTRVCLKRKRVCSCLQV